MALSTAMTRRPLVRGRRSKLLPSWSAFVTVAALIACLVARPADCQAEKRLSSVQQQQYYDSDDDGGISSSAEVIKSQIRPDSLPSAYSAQDAPPHKYEKQLHHGKQQQQDAVGSASTVYGEHYNPQDQPALDEEAQESISSGSINNHRIPQYTRGGSPVPVDVVEGKNVGNRAVGNRQVTTAGAGYAVDSSSAYGPHYSSQDLIQDQNYQLEFKYHDYDKMTKFLRTTSSKFPNLTALYSIGKSVQGTWTQSCRYSGTRPEGKRERGKFIPNSGQWHFILRS